MGMTNSNFTLIPKIIIYVYVEKMHYKVMITQTQILNFSLNKQQIKNLICIRYTTYSLFEENKKNLWVGIGCF